MGLGLPKVDVDVQSSLRAREIGTQSAMERVGKEMGPEKRRDEWDSGRNRRGRLILGALNIENPRIRRSRMFPTEVSCCSFETCEEITENIRFCMLYSQYHERQTEVS